MLLVKLVRFWEFSGPKITGGVICKPFFHRDVRTYGKWNWPIRKATCSEPIRGLELTWGHGLLLGKSNLYLASHKCANIRYAFQRRPFGRRRPMLLNKAHFCRPKSAQLQVSFWLLHDCDIMMSIFDQHWQDPGTYYLLTVPVFHFGLIQAHWTPSDYL
jgi:hypothetical protein